VGEILEVVRMGAYRLRKPHQLSGGQRQRVALARALVKRPKLLLLDEPLAALDRKLREHTQFELINVQQQLGVTFVVVTHDQEEAMTLATRIGVMNHGALVQVGTPREIYEHPATRFVADFIGSVNLLEAQVVESAAGRLLLRCAELSAPVLIERAEVSGGVGQLWVALRPEQILLSRSPPAQPHNWAQGVVREVAYRGEVSVVLVRLASGRELRTTLTNAAGGGLTGITRDEPVYLSWSSNAPVAGSA
jgi:putrescine transport system ATP-binding protein